MKKQLTGSYMQMNQHQIENLTTVVKETLAIEFNQPKTKIFTVADLWNIQRQGRTRTLRGFAF